MVRDELIWTHEKQGCSTSREQTINEISKFYHHSLVTASGSLETAAKLVLPCQMGRLNSTIAMKKGFSPYGHTRNIASNIGRHTCLVIAHNILYIQMKSTRTIPKPYISMFVCYGCGWTENKPKNST